MWRCVPVGPPEPSKTPCSEVSTFFKKEEKDDEGPELEAALREI